MSWTQRVKHPSELYQKGDEVEAVVLNIDSTARSRRSRSASSSSSPIRGIASPTTTRSGKIVEGKVIKVLDFGAFVELEKGVEGLIHVSEFSEERVEDPKTFVKPGQTLKAEIIGVDTAERKIGLSIRGAARAEELADAQGFSGGVPTATLGDVMRDKLAALTGKTVEESGEKQEKEGQEGQGRSCRRHRRRGRRRVVAAADFHVATLAGRV